MRGVEVLEDADEVCHAEGFSAQGVYTEVALAWGVGGREGEREEGMRERYGKEGNGERERREER